MATSQQQMLSAVTPAGGGVTYLYQTDFPGTSLPAGWVSDPTVTVAAALLTCANDGAQAYADSLFAAQTEVYIYFKILINSAAGGPPRIFGLYDAGFSNIQIYVDLTSNKFNVYDTTGLKATTVSTWTTGVTYNVWIHFKTGSGAGVTSVAFSTSTTEPTSGNDFAGATNSTSTASVRSPALQAMFGATESVSFSKFRVATTVIGNNPS